MPGLYAQWIDGWERKLASRDKDRVTRPFEWGLDWLDCDDPVSDPYRFVREYSRDWAARSEEFFACPRPSDFEFDGSSLTFTSPLVSHHPENNRVYAEFFPAARRARPRRAGFAAVECGRRWPHGAMPIAEPLRHLRAQDDHGLPRPAHAGGSAARRLSRLQQHRAHDPRFAAIGGGRPCVSGLAGGAGIRPARRSGDEPGVLHLLHHRGARFPSPGGRVQPRLEVLRRRGLDGAGDTARAAGIRRRAHPGRAARLLGGRQPGDLPGSA